MAGLLSLYRRAGGSKMCQGASLSISILAYTAKKGGLQNLSPTDLSAAIGRQLDGIQALLVSQGKTSCSTAFAFQPQGSGHHYTFLYPLPMENVKVRPNLNSRSMVTIAFSKLHHYLFKGCKP